MPSPSPRIEAERRRSERGEAKRRLAGRDGLVGYARLALFVAAVGTIWPAAQGTVPGPLPLFCFIGFMVLVVIHARVARELRRVTRAEGYWDRALARIGGTWAGRPDGSTGDRFLDEDHPYAPDLDLFGPGSMFERLCAARTSWGQVRLADWLKVAADRDEILARQAAIAEAATKLDFLEDLAGLGDDVAADGVQVRDLAAWGKGPRVLTTSLPLRIAAALLAVAAVVTLIGWGWFGFGRWPFFAALLAEAAIGAPLFRSVQKSLETIHERSEELDRLALLLARVEREPFNSPRWQRIHTQLHDRLNPKANASVLIGQLARRVQWLDARRNQFFALMAPLMLWSTQFAMAIESWRLRHGPEISDWLDAIADAEALASMAAYAFENPDDAFAEIVPVEDGPVLKADRLGHPLIAQDKCIRNDIAITKDQPVVAVSGSNMSGKSTWLRTVGLNAALALCGAPVRATSFAISPVKIGGTLRVHDSLQDGRSRFYAEILRLKQLLDLASGPSQTPPQPPLLFLVDEILHGTNSHDRRQGAEGILRALAARGAIGLFTTHDLALAGLDGFARSVHFADHLGDDGQLVFDYIMRPGVVQHSNALALMRSVGLDV